MNLLYTLPDEDFDAIKPKLRREPVVYCVPYDLYENGDYCPDGWVIVTHKALYLIKDRKVTETCDLTDVDEIQCSPQVNSGILAARKNGEDRFLCRFSMRYIIQNSYVARGASLFCQGENKTVQSAERERYCPKCGRVLPGTSKCPRCSGFGRNFQRFWDLCSHYMLPLILITVCMAGNSLLAVGQQSVQKNFIDSVLVPAKGTSIQIFHFFFIMLIFIAAMLALNIINTVWSNSLGTKISRDLRVRVYRKINELSMSFLNSRQTGELMNRVVDDTTQIREFMEQVFSQMFTQIFMMAAAMIMMLLINWKLALLTLFFLPFALGLVRMFRNLERRLYQQQWRFNDKVNGRLQDVISGIRVVKSFGQEKRETARFNQYSERLMHIQRRNELLWAALYPVVTFIITSGTFLIYYFCGSDILAGKMTPGQLVQFIAYANMLYAPLQFVSRLPRMIMRVKTSLERIYDILGEQPQIGDTKEAVDHDIEGNIVFSDVSFGYKSYEPVLEHVNLSVKQGEMIGLVGSSGSGKSTMINLLMRLYEVDGGNILVDNIPLTKISKQSLHRQIGVVLQETFLFTGTIFDNIRYAKPDATAEEVIKAAKMANAHDFITKFPDGYDTYVGEKGYTLSGGERQRIAIARAVLNNPRLLILDEATSSLDTETEYQIQEALKRLTEGRTTFAIAHRLSTLREADRIVVIDRHHIAEVGSHKELMRKKGIYYGLVMAQLEMHKVRS